MLYKLINNIWYNKNYYILSYFLLPFSVLWLMLVCFRWLRYRLTLPAKCKSFIICVGNINVGGGGKTPTVIYLSTQLAKLNYKIVVLKRLYKSNLNTNQLFIKNSITDANLVGDEACLINKYSDIVVCKSWKQGVKLVNQYNYDIVIMDDGLQNTSIVKDFNLLVVDSKYSFGNKLVLPAGPLRNFLFFNINRINSVLTLGNNNVQLNNFLKAKFSKQNIFHSNYTFSWHKDLESNNIVGFCGLAIPNKFLDTLVNNNFNVVKFFSFADHYLYTKKDIEYLQLQAQQYNAKLICTEKDLVKLSGYKNLNIYTIQQTIKNDNLIDFVVSRITLN